MTVFTASRRIAVSPEIAFAVAADVASYKDFLPLMQRSSIRGAKRPTRDGETFDAELAVSYPKLGLSESFVSRVETHVSEQRVEAVSTEAPFRRIETRWQVKPVTTGCDVTVTIDYAFRNPLLQLVAGGAMDFAIQKVMAAFEARALYIAKAATS